MKMTTTFLGMLMSGALLFSSCAKNLKDDIKELQQQVGGIESILGSNEPITVTTTFVDDNDSTRKISEVYKFKSSNAGTQYMVSKGNGTYEIYIERFSDVEWYEGAWAGFDYNPTTKEISNKRGGHYWDDMDPYYDNVRYIDSYTPAPTINITIQSINITTGDISMSFSATGDAAYTAARAYWEVPNQGKPVSTNFTFTGKLKVFPTE